MLLRILYLNRARAILNSNHTFQLTMGLLIMWLLFIFVFPLLVLANIE